MNYLVRTIRFWGVFSYIGEDFFYSVSTTIAVHILQNYAKFCILYTEMTDT